MKLPMSWLKDWLDFEATPETVANALTTRGFYVEGIEHRGRSFPLTGHAQQQAAGDLEGDEASHIHPGRQMRELLHTVSFNGSQ